MEKQQTGRRTGASDREALRGYVALKGFFGICTEWGCSQEEMRQLLGGISQTTLEEYEKLPHTELPLEALKRISYVMGVYKSLRTIYPTAERANRRIRLPTRELPFCGVSALDFMTQGSMKHLKQARRYFDGKLGWS